MQDLGRVVFTADPAAVVAEAELVFLCTDADLTGTTLPVAILPEAMLAHPSRIVVGVESDAARAAVERVGFEVPVLFMSFASALLVREAAEAFVAAKVSFVSDLAVRCERTGADLRDVADALAAELTIGADLVRPDQNFFSNLERELGGLKDRRIAVWGLNDLESVRWLYARGADLIAYDPKRIGPASEILPGGIEYASTAVDACEGAEALVVLSDAHEFRDVSFATVRERMIEPRVFDGRNLLADMDLSGFSYYGVGIPR